MLKPVSIEMDRMRVRSVFVVETGYMRILWNKDYKSRKLNKSGALRTLNKNKYDIQLDLNNKQI